MPYTSPTKLASYDSRPLVFLLANWYSGATILSILLNNHTSISCNGELVPFWNQSPDTLICSCGASLEACPFYAATCDHFRSDGKFDQSLFSPVPVFYRQQFLRRALQSFKLAPIVDRLAFISPRYRKLISLFINVHLEMFDNIKTIDKSTIYVDGTKSIRRVDLFARFSDKPIKVLHMIRDGRKFAASYKNVRKPTGDPVVEAAKHWNSYIDMIDTLTRRHRRIELKMIRHEDLCSNKESTVEGICEFLNVDYDSTIFQFEKKQYHVLGNKMRHKFDGTIRESSSWRNVLSKSDVNNLTSLIRINLDRFGY